MISVAKVKQHAQNSSICNSKKGNLTTTKFGHHCMHHHQENNLGLKNSSSYEKQHRCKRHQTNMKPIVSTNEKHGWTIDGKKESYNILVGKEAIIKVAHFTLPFPFFF
jgi:hypothetical protein